MPSPQIGLQFILNNALANGRNFYAMLTSTLLGLTSDMPAATSGEMMGFGYQRLPLTFNSAIITADGYAGVTSSLIQFVASGGIIGPFQCLAIVDQASGSAGNIISYYNYSAPISIADGAAFTVNYPIKQTTQ